MIKTMDSPYNFPYRRSIRLQDYDYGQSGTYFVTICTYDRLPIFGTVSGETVILTPYGNIVVTEWERTAELRAYIEMDAFVVMPNHIHGILVLTDLQNEMTTKSGKARAYFIIGHLYKWLRLYCRGAIYRARKRAAHQPPLQPQFVHFADSEIASRLAPTQAESRRLSGKPPARALSSVIGSFKSAVARKINLLRGTPAAPVWQRNYYEHIIRSENTLNDIREYIATNPARWYEDTLYTPGS